MDLDMEEEDDEEADREQEPEVEFVNSPLKDPWSKRFFKPMGWHGEKRVYQCMAGECRANPTKQFAGTKGLSSHKNTHLKPYQCDQCEEKFSSSRKKLEHVERVHDELVEECDQCGKQFPVGNNLDQHIRKVHNKQ